MDLGDIARAAVVLTLGACLVFAICSNPILLVLAVVIAILWCLFKYTLEEGINGAIDVLLSFFGFGALCVAIYSYWVGEDDFAICAVLSLFAIGGLHGLRDEVNRWRDERNARRTGRTIRLP